MFKAILNFFSLNKSRNKTRSSSTTVPELNGEVVFDFATQDKHINAGFNKVFKNIVISDQLKKRIYGNYRNAHDAGSPRQEEKCLMEALGGTNWAWPLFDKWEQSFTKRNLFPFSWAQYRKSRNVNIQPPTTLEDALTYFTGKQMKVILSEKKVKGRSKATTVEDLRNMILNNCTLRDINLQLHSKLENIDNRSNSDMEKEKIKLLHRYIGATIYSIRDCQSRESLPPVFKFTAKSSNGCPVEEKFAKAYNQGKLNKVPPLFPGDSTYITSSPLQS